MTQLLKAALVSLVIALSLTSDTAQSASQFQVSGLKVQGSGQSCSMNSSVCVASGQMPKSWELQSWTLPPAMPLYGSTPK